MSPVLRTRRPVVLLVEDNPVDAKMLQRANEHADEPCLIINVDNGPDALTFLRRLGGYGAAPRPDLVLLDLNLPGLHGLEVLEHIKSDPVIAGIPVVVLSTSDLQADIDRTYSLQGAAYLKKPTGGDEFNDLFTNITKFWLESVLYPSGV